MKNQLLCNRIYRLACLVFVAVLCGFTPGCEKEGTKSKEGTPSTQPAASTQPTSGAAPSGGGNAAGLKLAFVTNNASEFWKIAAAGIHAYEKESGVKVNILQPPNGTVEEQNGMLENLVSQHYDAIAISAIAPADQTGVINDTAGKTKVICFDSDAGKSQAALLYRHG